MTDINKINCWEYHNCGKKKTCRAYPDNGRRCMYVKGTFCMKDKDPSHKKDCNDCGFFRMVFSLS